VANLGIPPLLHAWRMAVVPGAPASCTAGTGTVIIENKIFNDIGNGYIPIFRLTAFLRSAQANATARNSGHRPVHRRPDQQPQAEGGLRLRSAAMNLFVVKLVVLSIVFAAITWVLAGYNGSPGRW